MIELTLEIKAPPPPAGFSYTGELRRAAFDEWYAYEGEAHRCAGEAGEYLILRRVEPKKESRTVWLNVYPGEEGVFTHRTRESADRAAGGSNGGRIACIEMPITFTEGDGLAQPLTPAE